MTSPVDVVPTEVRVPSHLAGRLLALTPTELGIALSLLHHADPYVCAARAAVDVADLRHGALTAQTEVSHDDAAAVLAQGMRAEPIRPVQIPRQPVRCDACHRVRAPLRLVTGGWTWHERPDQHTREAA